MDLGCVVVNDELSGHFGNVGHEKQLTELLRNYETGFLFVKATLKITLTVSCTPKALFFNHLLLVQSNYSLSLTYNSVPSNDSQKQIQ